MKKKLFCIVLSLAMVVVFMPAMAMTAFADEPVCQVGSTTYTSVKAAVDGFTSSTTCTITMLADSAETADIVIPSRGTFVLDLNDKTIKTANIKVNNGRLTIKNGGYAGASAVGGTIVNENGTVNLESGVVYKKDVTNTTNSTDSKVKAVLNINGGAFATGTHFTNSAKSEMNIAAGSFQSPEFTNNGKMTIKGGEFSGLQKFENNAELTISGGTFDNSNASILNMGVLNVTGGVFQNGHDVVFQNGGSVSSEAGYATTAKLNISGGTFQKNLIEAEKNGGVILNYGCPVNITGGTFKDNSVNGKGGVLYSERPNAFSVRVPILVKNATMTNNKANKGGAIYVQDPTDLTFAGATNVSNNYHLDADGKTKVIDNVAVLAKSPVKIFSDALTGQVGVRLPVNDKDDPFANYFDANADLSKFVSDFNRGTFKDGSKFVSDIDAAVDEALQAIKALEACYYILHIDDNYGDGVNAKGAEEALEALRTSPDATVKAVENELDKWAATMFGTKVDAIKVLAKNIAKGTMTAAAGAAYIAAVAADKALEATVNVATAVSEDVKDVANTVVTVVGALTKAALDNAKEAAEATVTAIGTLGTAAKEALEASLKFIAVTAYGTGAAIANGLDLLGQGAKTVLDTGVKVAEAAATAAAIQAVVGGVVNYAGQLFSAVQARNVYNNAIKSISGLVGQASENAAALLQKGAQAGGVVLANGVQVGGKLLELLAAGKITASVAGAVANTVAYIGSFAKHPVYHF